MRAHGDEMNVLSPLMNMPAIATITVAPEISTARPEVAAAASSDALSLRPGRALLALRIEAVVHSYTTMAVSRKFS